MDSPSEVVTIVTAVPTFAAYDGDRIFRQLQSSLGVATAMRGSLQVVHESPMPSRCRMRLACRRMCFVDTFKARLSFN